MLFFIDHLEEPTIESYDYEAYETPYGAYTWGIDLTKEQFDRLKAFGGFTGAHMRSDNVAICTNVVRMLDKGVIR